MKYREAVSEAIQGARIVSPSIQAGAFVDYQFNGLRIVYEGGSSSGFRPTAADEMADWTIQELDTVKAVDEPPSRDKWGRPI